MIVGHEKAKAFRAYQRSIHVREDQLYYEPGEQED